MVTLYAVWVAWLLFWAVMSFSGKHTVRRESRGSRLSHMLPMCLAACLLIARDFHGWVAFLSRDMLPYRPAFYAIGVAMVIAGLAYAVWARLHLGRNWSASVQVKDDHELVRTGPYRWVRHPIYTGMLIGLLGTMVAFDEWRALLALVIVFGSIWFKLKREERWMLETFGDAYADYRRHSRALIPFLL